MARLWTEDSNILQISAAGAGRTLNVVVSAKHPYGAWSTNLNSPVDTGLDDTTSTNTYQRTNASYAVLYGFETSPQWLQKRQQKLALYLQQGLSATSRQVTAETLNVMGLSWMVQKELVSEMTCQQQNLLPCTLHSYGRMGQEQNRGYFVDVYMDLDGAFPSTGYSSSDLLTYTHQFDTAAFFYSALEYGVIEQLQRSNIVGASTVKMLEIAASNSETIYMASNGNWSSISGSLTHYNTSAINVLDGLISKGFILLLPKDGSNHVAGPSSWAGDAFVEFGGLGNKGQIGMIINGSYNGGESSDLFDEIDAFYVWLSGESPSTAFNSQPPTLSLPHQNGGDPINMLDGTFEITSTDLSLGQTEPRGLNLTRYYSSERINYNPAGMGPGWLHTYFCQAVSFSDPEVGLGTGTVEQMCPMIVATYAGLNFYTGQTPDPKNWTVTALIAKWGIDQLIANAVSVSLGDKTIEFARQPDGSYTPPGNCTMTLIQSNNAFCLQERHGRTFMFNTNNVLTNIVDPYGVPMTLAYNSNNFVTNVTDWANRSLSFTYTSNVLTGVSDSTGRSIAYGYSGGELTTYTDPEMKTTTYAYDTNNELISTFDALGNLVVSNYYDGFGHITTQLTEGNSGKTWQALASGGSTFLIDPLDDETVYTYDAQSRLIAYTDGMGNITQLTYDGQDHLIQTVSPLNETNQYVYDGNNNLIETIDPLGNTNGYVYDSNNNLITSFDDRGNASHFGYNAQGSQTGATNGNGDWIVYTYNVNGTPFSRVDSAGTTDYAYDTYGQLSSVTYPSSLGSESFVNSALGDPTSHTDARGFTTTFAYNNRRQLTNTVAPTNVTTKATFDANANLSTMVDARGFTISNNWSTTRELLSTTFPTTPQGIPVVVKSYDSRDWLASTEDPLGNTTYFTDDAAQRLIASSDPLQRTNIFAYDGDDHQIGSTNAAGNVTSQSWDARGELIQIVDAATNIVGKKYDAAGNLNYLTNRNGKLWSFQYDGANRLTNTVSPLGYSVSQVYNNRGLLQSTTDALGHLTTNGYDPRGRLTTTFDGTGTTTYQLDGNGNRTQISENGESIQQAFDAYNHVSSFTDVNGLTVQYRRDSNGNITNLIYPGNLTVSYFYDSNNRLTNVTDWNGRQTALSYDLANHVTSVTRPNNTMRLMSYDSDGELTNIVEETTGKFPICLYTLNYNAAGRVQWEFKGPLPHSNAPPTRTMTYDNDNRLSAFNGTSVTVDSAGNLTYGPGTNNTFETYGYDSRNRVTGVAGVGYTYDPANNRVFSTNGANVSQYVIDPQTSQVLVRITGGVTNYYVYGGGLLYEIDETATTATTAYYHFDCRGSTVAITDSSGNPTDLVEYSSYGTTTYRFGTNSTPFLYNGQFGVQTDANGLLYMRARYYDPYISRFINADPSGFNGGLNFYLFCNDNPVNAEDPFGLDGQFSIGISGTFGGSPWIMPPAGFVGGGAALGVTSSGQIFLQVQAVGMTGGGFFGAVGVQGGYTHSASDTPVGFSTSTAIHGEVNAGWGSGAVGLAGDFGSDSSGANFPVPQLDVGVGYGAMIGVGVSTTTTWATPTIMQMINYIFPPVQYAVYSPIIAENAPPVIVVGNSGPSATGWLGNPIQSSGIGKPH